MTAWAAGKVQPSLATARHATGFALSPRTDTIASESFVAILMKRRRYFVTRGAFGREFLGRSWDSPDKILLPGVTVSGQPSAIPRGQGGEPPAALERPDPPGGFPGG